MSDINQSLLQWAEEHTGDPTETEVDTSSLGELRPTLVRASAGSGKTYQLTARLLRILLQGAAPETILATTFTRKAAGEILSRVLVSLAKAADENDDDGSLESLRSQVGLPTLPRSACLNLLDTLLRNMHRLRICTLDSLFAQIARSFPFELNLPPAWRLTDEIEEVWMRERAIDQTISSLDRGEIISLLAMLGKGEVKRSVTRELMNVVETAYAIQRQADKKAWTKMAAPKLPESAAITKAAGEMLTATPKQKTLKAKLEKMGSAMESREFACLDGETLITNIAKSKLSGDPIKFGRSIFPDGLGEAFKVLYAIARSEMLRLLKAQNEATGSVLQTYDFQINSLKQAKRALGFDDVSIRLANQFASLDEQSLSMRMDGAVDHLLLDEFQDTSPIQWQVLRPLAVACASSSGGATVGDTDRPIPRSFFCVGDTKQAIYGWRGGVAEIFDAVAKEVPEVEEVSQNQSFRSSPVIMEAVNAIFPRLSRHPIVTDSDPSNRADKSAYEADAILQFSNQFPEHETARKSLPGHARLVTSRASDGGADEKRQTCFEDAAIIAKDLVDSAPEKNVGILTRTNKGVAEMIYLLEQMKVEVSQEGGNPLTDSAAVEIVLSSLMMAEHPGDKRWSLHANSTPLAEIDDFGPDWVRRMTDENGIAETVEFLASRLAGICDDRDTMRLKQLTRLAIQYETNPAPRLRDFVRMVREKRVERPQAAPVRVMTVHQSKGLEFDSVILPQLESDLVRPSTKPVAMADSPDQPPTGLTRYVGSSHWHFLSQDWQQVFGAATSSSMTEAMCLMYVAMTRARQSLHLVIPPARKAQYNTKTAASLIFHALDCDEDPTQPETVLWEIGDANWMEM
ncbi:ATP-dependent DNA helicase Rep [Rubripirellula obstinata]|uniref:DNA 3'-5' helicase n=1 Tax=Rubripirellula obstinata TaxID=406547 RepID=A0A5B1CIL4_9BACT|nr:UvrD-helicase domain-containing protein [Rubripirellula obstinata]KAA1259755.1 ATP-dependent DNA helicase Rep [Rubripirellula obstinata]